MKMFVQEVYDQQAFTGETVYSDPAFNELLASAEKLVVQVTMENSTSAPTVNITFQTSNDNRNFADLFTSPGAQTPSTSAIIPYFWYTSASAGANVNAGGYIRLKIVIAGTGNGKFRVIVCGRGEQGGM